MDVRGFVEQLLDALASTGQFRNVSLQTEGPIASGRVYVHGAPGQFLRMYFNEATGTIAFTLIDNQRRVWGIDFDNRRGWHEHPVENPSEHVAIYCPADHLRNRVIAARRPGFSRVKWIETSYEPQLARQLHLLARQARRRHRPPRGSLLGSAARS